MYDLPGRGAETGYREQAETSELFAMHHDGLASGGTVQTAFLYCAQSTLLGVDSFRSIGAEVLWGEWRYDYDPTKTSWWMRRKPRTPATYPTKRTLAAHDHQGIIPSNILRVPQRTVFDARQRATSESSRYPQLLRPHSVNEELAGGNSH